MPGARHAGSHRFRSDLCPALSGPSVRNGCLRAVGAGSERASCGVPFSRTPWRTATGRRRRRVRGRSLRSASHGCPAWTSRELSRPPRMGRSPSALRSTPAGRSVRVSPRRALGTRAGPARRRSISRRSTLRDAAKDRSNGGCAVRGPRRFRSSPSRSHSEHDPTRSGTARGPSGSTSQLLAPVDVGSGPVSESIFGELGLARRAQKHRRENGSEGSGASSPREPPVLAPAHGLNGSSFGTANR